MHTPHLLKQRNYAHLNILYRNYESKATFLAHLKSVSTSNMWVDLWFHQQHHCPMKRSPFQIEPSLRFFFHNLDNKFPPTSQPNDRKKSCYLGCHELRILPKWKCLWFVEDCEISGVNDLKHHEIKMSKKIPDDPDEGLRACHFLVYNTYIFGILTLHSKSSQTLIITSVNKFLSFFWTKTLAL